MNRLVRNQWELFKVAQIRLTEGRENGHSLKKIVWMGVCGSLFFFILFFE